MGKGQNRTGYCVTFDPEAIEDLKKLNPQVRKRVATRIDWLGENAGDVQHRRLKHLPEHLRGLCKYRVGKYRVLYWLYQDQREIRVYGVIHRRTDYGELQRG